MRTRGIRHDITSVGLDDSRAGPGDRRTPLDGIVKKLARHGRTLVHLVNLMQDLSARGVGLCGCSPAKARRSTPARGEAYHLEGRCGTQSRSSAWPCSSSSGRTTSTGCWRGTTTEAPRRYDATSSGWTRPRRCEYRQTTVQEPWGATASSGGALGLSRVLCGHRGPIFSACRSGHRRLLHVDAAAEMRASGDGHARRRQRRWLTHGELTGRIRSPRSPHRKTSN